MHGSLLGLKYHLSALAVLDRLGIKVWGSKVNSNKTVSVAYLKTLRHQKRGMRYFDTSAEHFGTDSTGSKKSRDTSDREQFAHFGRRVRSVYRTLRIRRSKCPDTSAPILWCRSVLWP